jgi:hypothetical protein
VNEIYRIRLVDGSEWLKSRQIWKGLDTAGNELDISMNDKEMYDSGRAIYSLKPEDPKDKSTHMLQYHRSNTSRVHPSRSSGKW